ncbi:MAG: GNAT family N-acetyltransferase [Microscillaceae bacterium]|jgi:ribosomal protein S18 acetylase RimI-like enzyme|nr:GNAT family N-acetyltransferase [Microscillaceae bacterium]
MPFELIEAQTQHLNDLLPLIEKFYRHFDYPFDYEQHSRIVLDFLQNPHYGKIWLIKSENQFLGYIALTFGYTFEYGGKDAFVDEFFIAPEYRSQGIGKQALNEIQKLAKPLQLNALHLQTESYNTRAKELYQNVGFKDKNRSTLTWVVE